MQENCEFCNHLPGTDYKRTGIICCEEDACIELCITDILKEYDNREEKLEAANRKLITISSICHKASKTLDAIKHVEAVGEIMIITAQYYVKE